MYYAGFTIICEGVAAFPTKEAMKAWLNHATEIDRFLNRDAIKHESSQNWDDCMGERVQFSPEQVNKMFGGSLKNALYAQPEPSTGEKVLWYYMPL